MHIEVKSKDKAGADVTTFHVITSLEFHAARGDAFAMVKPFASLEAYDKGEDPLSKGQEFRLNGYPSGPGVNVEAWAYDSILPSIEGGTIVDTAPAAVAEPALPAGPAAPADAPKPAQPQIFPPPA